MDAPEVEDWIATLAIAEQTARLLRDISEDRLEIVERTINRALLG